MIIDIHTHTFPPAVAEGALRSMQANSHTALFSDGTAEGLRASMTRGKIDLSLVQPVATNPAKISRINDRVLETNRNTARTGILSFGAVHPAAEDWERELERLSAEGVRGVKVHPCYEETDIDDPRTVSILRKCKELDLIVLIHAGWDVGLPGSTAALPGKIRRALDAAGGVKMIAAHMGGWKCWEDAARLLPETGVYLDTAYSLGRLERAPEDSYWTDRELETLSAGDFCGLVHLFGAKQVLFGTDSPWADQRAEAERIRGLPLKQKEISDILGDNAAKLLGLS